MNSTATKMADHHDDIAALLQDAARVMNDNNDDDSDDDDSDDDDSDDDDNDDDDKVRLIDDSDTGSFMSPGFVVREITADATISPTDLMMRSSSLLSSAHSHSNSTTTSTKMTPTTFLDRMLFLHHHHHHHHLYPDTASPDDNNNNHNDNDVVDVDMDKLLAPNLDGDDDQQQQQLLRQPPLSSSSSLAIDKAKGTAAAAATTAVITETEEESDAAAAVVATNDNMMFDTSGEEQQYDDDDVDVSHILDLDDYDEDVQEGQQQQQESAVTPSDDDDDDDDDDDMEDAQMEEDLVDIEALMSQSVMTTTTRTTGKNTAATTTSDQQHHHSNNNNSNNSMLGGHYHHHNLNNSTSSTVTKNAFELLMSQSVSDILKDQEYATTTTMAVSAASPPVSRPGTPLGKNSHNDSTTSIYPPHRSTTSTTVAAQELQEHKSPVDRAISGLFKAMGGVFLQPNLLHHQRPTNNNDSNNTSAPVTDGYDILAATQRDRKNANKEEEKEDDEHDHGKMVTTLRPKLESNSAVTAAHIHTSRGTMSDGLVVEDNFLSSFQLLAHADRTLTAHHRASSSILSRESSEDAMSFVTATENMVSTGDTPKSSSLLTMPSLETIDTSFPAAAVPPPPPPANQATTPKRSGSFVPPTPTSLADGTDKSVGIKSGNIPPPGPQQGQQQQQQQQQHQKHHQHSKVLKPAALSSLGRGDGLIMTIPVGDAAATDQVSPMASLAVHQVEQVFRTNEVLVQQQDLVSLSSASSTAGLSQVSKATTAEPSNSRWIKPGAISSAAGAALPTFNPSRSIFATKSNHDSNISPPGSPPEPVYSWADDDDDDNDGDNDTLVMTFPEAVNWEMLSIPVEDGMITESSSVNASDHGSRTTRLSAKQQQRLNSPDRVLNSMTEMRQRVKSPDKKGVALAISPSKGRNPDLEEKLASFLTLNPIGLPFRYHKPAHLDYVASLCWQQLLTCWKHSEMARALTTQQPSRHFDRQHRPDDRVDDDGEISSGSSRIVRRPLIANLRLNGIELHPPIRPETKNLDGFNPGDGLAMTRFLDSLPSRGGFLRHDVENLLEFADQTTAEFAKLMETVVAFARFDSADVEFEINVKLAEAITKKARQKYGGDLRQVKDVLRSKIIFPTESSLVCGLIKLFQRREEQFKVVRIKNLFRRADNDDLIDSPLPTKYRHILVNIKWKSGFLSEIQLNLARMYDIMQDEGCKLHQQLMDLKSAWNGFPPTLTALRISILSQAPAGQVQSFLAGASLSPCEAESGSRKGDEGAIQQLKAPNLEDPSNSTDHDNEPRCNAISSREHLDELRKTMFSDGDIFLAILEKACLDTSRRPRDLPIHYCCYLIFRSILHNANDTDHLPFLGFNVNTRAELADRAKSCLMRALTISNQALSVGMYGWLEYGTMSPLVRLLGQPFDLLRLLAYDYALLGQWTHAERVLKERLLRCEQHLPRYHPTTLICMIDLAVASQNTGQKRLASRLASQASIRLSDYLAEMEKALLLNLSKSTKVSGKVSDTVVRIEHGRDALIMLQAFVSIMRQEMKREMVDIVMLAESNEAILVNHCFLGEALCILANCRAASRALSGCRKELRGVHDQLWTEAGSHFHLALSGFIVQHHMTSMVVARAAFGLARCLRESNESEKALEILSLITSRHLQSDQPHSSSSFGSVAGAGSSLQSQHPPSRFLRAPKSGQPALLKQVIASLCLWLMAALALDRSPDEDGRGLAFRYLHAASVSLQTTLSQASEDDPLRSSYIQFLSMIEDEALQIAEPIYE